MALLLNHSLGVLNVKLELKLSLDMELGLFRNIPSSTALTCPYVYSPNGPVLSVTFMFIGIYFTHGLRKFILALSGLEY